MVVSSIAVAALALALASPASATHVDPDVAHGWVACSGVENAHATGYGNAILTTEVVFESWSQSSASYYRYQTSPPGSGSGHWAAESNDDLVPSSSYGHCG